MIKIEKGSIRMEGTAVELLSELTFVVRQLRYDALPKNGWSDEDAEKIVREALDLGTTAPDALPKKVLGRLADVLKRVIDKMKKEEK